MYLFIISFIHLYRELQSCIEKFCIFQPALHPNKSIIDLIFEIYMHIYVYVFLKEIIGSMTRLWQEILISVELYGVRLGSKNIRELVAIKFKFQFESQRDWTYLLHFEMWESTLWATVAFRSQWPSFWGSWTKQKTHSVTEGELCEPTGCGYASGFLLQCKSDHTLLAQWAPASSSPIGTLEYILKSFYVSENILHNLTWQVSAAFPQVWFLFILSGLTCWTVTSSKTLSGPLSKGGSYPDRLPPAPIQYLHGHFSVSTSLFYTSALWWGYQLP